MRTINVEDARVDDDDHMDPVPSDAATMGEIVVRSNTVMQGYLRDPDQTAEAFAGGWFHTGDLAVVHPDGYIEIRDRSKDIIVSGGENVSSIEVENVLISHPAVSEVAWVRERLAHYKAPRSVTFGPLPKTSTGKIQKFDLRGQLRRPSP